MKPEYHHIIKRCDGGKITLDNGVILDKTAHQYLHLIEYYEKRLYEEINELLKIQNINGIRTKEIRNIYDILFYFENAYRYKENKHNKLIIKEEYKKNRILLLKK